jgi:glycosyltransferase involved in cell wall biosynthesis
VLVISHSHPELTKGGAEIAAYNHYLQCAESNPDTTWFLGCSRDVNGQHVGAVFSQPFGPQEYVYACGAFDWFNFSNMDARFPDEFRALLSELKPDEVHFHHYINIGLEAILHVREVLPNCRITMTLHEYLAICHHYGQMVTKPALTPCHGASPRKCVKCFPEKAPEDFFLRKRYVDRFFELVDDFISPSEFLAGRYQEWGVSSTKMTVQENIIRMPTIPPRNVAQTDLKSRPLRVGFFGQISKLKGINVLLAAAALLNSDSDLGFVFEIYGDDSGQPPEFQQDFREGLKNAGLNVIYRGPYDRLTVGHLMSSLDAVVVPSIWWENSPVVIQEAQACGVHLLCSDIGGMAEKITAAPMTGTLFPVGNHIALCDVLRQLRSRLGLSPLSIRENPTRQVCAGVNV